ncbi:DEAD/DEAH box helicase [bacterium]|nr:DEAD/DEAH box helicase [bacterium]
MTNERSAVGKAAGIATGAAKPPGYPTTFVSVDLETTGLKSGTDRIIEIGAVRITGGVVDGIYSTLVSPGIPIPSDIVYLTGNSNDDVAEAPDIDTALRGLVEFCGDAPLVAQNAPFDIAFLRIAAADRPEFLVGQHGVFDTLPLARALVPRLRSHRLAALAEFFGVTIENAHRAESDAAATATVFLRLLDTLDQIGPAILTRMVAMADPQMRLLIETAREKVGDRLKPYAVPDHGQKENDLLRYDVVRGEEFVRVPREDRLEIDLDAVEGQFASDGAIAGELPKYEERREQLEMMRAVGDAFNNGIDLVVEAGTGVGKSLAYLVPAVHFAVLNGERVIVSTNTRNLQEQLFNKDVPFLERALGVGFSVALLKGRGNYLCRERWARLLERGLSPEERAGLLPVALWEAETTSGDVSELAAVQRRSYLWSRISADGGPCLGQKCPHNDTCYLMRARRAAQSAHVVVVNHSLLFSDSETDNRVLGEYSFLICDEAHNLERVATEHLGRRAGVWRTRTALDALGRRDGGDAGVLADIISRLRREQDGGIISSVVEAAERAVGELGTVRKALEMFYSALNARHEELNNGRPVEFGKLRYRPDAPVSCIVAGELESASASLSFLISTMTTLADLAADSGVESTDVIVQALQFETARMTQLAEDIVFLAEGGDPDSVFWLEVRSYGGTRECELRSAPVSVAERMHDFLYSKLESLVLTSATLTVDGSFDFFCERLGLDTLEDWKLVMLDVGSPYDYTAQAISIVAQYMSEPSSRGFNQAVADLVVKLAAPAAGGTLVLFTSRSSLDTVFKLVRDRFSPVGKLLLAQGHGAPRTALLEEFARETDSVLLATSSFWEGVDVPGRSLEQLVIVKLPFPVPSDPVVEAHCERYEQAGEHSFSRYMVPRTAIGLRQGFGRLIRSSTDMGGVIFLDSRLASRRYGTRLLDQLPTNTMFARDEAELLAALEGLHKEES